MHQSLAAKPELPPSIDADQDTINTAFTEMTAALADLAINVDFEKLEAEKLGNQARFNEAAEEIGSILTFDDEKQTRTLQQIKSEMSAYLARPEIMQMQSILDMAAMQMHQFCMHNGVDQNQMFEGFDQFLPEHGPNDGHNHSEHLKKSKEDDDDEYEWVIVNGKRVRRRKRR